MSALAQRLATHLAAIDRWSTWWGLAGGFLAVLLVVAIAGELTRDRSR